MLKSMALRRPPWTVIGAWPSTRSILAPIWLEMVGAWLATLYPHRDLAEAARAIGGRWILVVIALGLIGVVATNMYSGMLALAGLAMIIPMFVPSRWVRPAVPAYAPGFDPEFGRVGTPTLTSLTSDLAGSGFTTPGAAETSVDNGGLLSDWAQTRPQAQTMIRRVVVRKDGYELLSESNVADTYQTLTFEGELTSDPTADVAAFGLPYQMLFTLPT